MPKVTSSTTAKKTTRPRVRKTMPARPAPAMPLEPVKPVRTNDRIHWAVFIIVSLLVAGAVIYVGRPDPTAEQTSMASSLPQSPTTDDVAPPYVPEPTAYPLQAQMGVIGEVTDIGADSITIKSIAPTEKNGLGTIYTVHVKDSTQFVYHPVTSNDDAETKTFGTKKGQLSEIKKGMYASATTLADVNKETAFDAIEINYSEDSPLE